MCFLMKSQILQAAILTAERSENYYFVSNVQKQYKDIFYRDVLPFIVRYFPPATENTITGLHPLNFMPIRELIMAKNPLQKKEVTERRYKNQTIIKPKQTEKEKEKIRKTRKQKKKWKDKIVKLRGLNARHLKNKNQHRYVRASIHYATITDHWQLFLCI